ncbi:Uncharacterised protein [uncultured Blautia sp.]|nr:Uncharacterised protein [uncultured Blautia sp.]
MAHGDAVAHADGGHHEGGTAGGLDAAFYRVGQLVQIHVSGNDVAVGADHSDQGLLQVLRRVAQGVEKAPVGCPLGALGHIITAHRSCFPPFSTRPGGVPASGPVPWVLLLFQPAHHAAQLGAHLLDGVLGRHATHGQEVGLAASVGVHLRQEFGGEGTVLDLLEDLPHLLAGVLGNQAAAGAVVAVLSGVGDGVAHLAEAALVDEVDDELHLVAGLEVGHLRLVAGLHQGLEAGLDQAADAAA